MRVWLLLLLLLVLPFQNCISSQIGETTKPSTTLQGNGSGYDGKLFVHLSAGVCADSKGYDSAIEGRNGAFYLTREDCADIPRDLQIQVPVHIDPVNDSHIYYENRLYIETLNLVSTLEAVSGGFLSYGVTFKVENARLHRGDRYVGIFDPQGRPQWAKKFERPFDIELLRVSALPGHESIMSLRYRTASAESTVIARLDGGGNVKWAYTLRSPDARKVRFIAQRIEAGGAVYLAGALQPSDSSAAALLVKLDSEGQEIFARTFTGTANSTADLELAPGGGVYLHGKSGSSAYVMKVSSNGTAEWSRSYTELFDAQFSLADDGAIILKARRQVPDAPVVIFWTRYIEIDPADGSFVRSAKFDETRLAYAYGGRIAASSDGGFYAFVPGAGNDNLITRLNRDFSVDWARRVTYPDGIDLHRIERTANGFYSFLSKTSSLAPYGTDLLVATDMKNLPSLCTLCAPENVTVSAAEAVTAAQGPELGPLTGLIYEAGSIGALTDISIKLPFTVGP